MINMDIVHMEIVDIEDMNPKLVDAELKIWRKVEDIAYAEAKHPDEVYADLMVMFGEFLEQKYPSNKYSNEKSTKAQIKKPRSRKTKKTIP
jgi:hypothetical protein